MTLEAYHLNENHEVFPPVDEYAELLFAQRLANQRELGRISTVICIAHQLQTVAIEESLRINKEFAKHGLNSADYVYRFQSPQDMNEELFGSTQSFIDDEEVIEFTQVNN